MNKYLGTFLKRQAWKMPPKVEKSKTIVEEIAV